MQKELTCSQVMALMNFYLENKLTPKLRGFVDAHLQHCERCRKIYSQSLNIAGNTSASQNFDENLYITPQYQEFRDKLSAYIDNELNEHDSIKIKKMAITNPAARRDLENMLNFRRVMHNSFAKTKSEWKNDYARLIMRELGKEQGLNFGFSKIAYSFGFLMIFALLGLLAILWF